MIEVTVKLTGCCKDCPHIDLNTDSADIFAGNKCVYREMSISCAHEEVCGALKSERAAKVRKEVNPHDCN